MRFVIRVEIVVSSLTICFRPSQSMGPAMLANRLTQGLRDNGDLGYAEGPTDGDVDMEDSSQMGGHASQFTQSLMLFVRVYRAVRLHS